MDTNRIESFKTTTDSVFSLLSTELREVLELKNHAEVTKEIARKIAGTSEIGSRIHSQLRVKMSRTVFALSLRLAHGKAEPETGEQSPYKVLCSCFAFVSHAHSPCSHNGVEAPPSEVSALSLEAPAPTWR